MSGLNEELKIRQYGSCMDRVLRRHSRAIALGQRLATILKPGFEFQIRLVPEDRRAAYLEKIRSIIEPRLGGRMPRDRQVLTWAASVAIANMRQLRRRLDSTGENATLEELLARREGRSAQPVDQALSLETESIHSLSSLPESTQSADAPATPKGAAQ